MYETKNSLQVIIEDLDLALKRGCLFAALSLALIIPDICGKAKDGTADKLLDFKRGFPIVRLLLDRFLLISLERVVGAG